MIRTDKEKKNKTDIHDSRSLAFNLEKAVFVRFYVMSRQQREFRSLFRLGIEARDLAELVITLKLPAYFGIDYSQF